MTSPRLPSSVRFTFGSCSSSIVVRTTSAAVDQLCGAADISVALFDALEVPLSESLTALHRIGIAVVDVSVEGDELVLEITARDEVTSSPDVLFGDSVDIIESFFDVRQTGDARTINLTGSLL